MGRKGTERLLDSFRAWLNEPIQNQLSDLSMQVHREFRGVKKQMALNADELKARMNEATSNIGSDVRSLKDKLAEALADKDAYADSKVQEALSGFDSLADRLDNLAADTPDDELSESETPSEPEVPGEAPDVEGGEVAGPSDPFATDEDGDANSANPNV